MRMIVATSERMPFVWTRDAYERAGEAGVFGDLRVELIEGQVLQMSPMGSRHSTTVSRVYEELRLAFGKNFYVRSQMTVDLNERSQLEPDLAVVRGHVDDFDDFHPKRADLIVEVAETSLRFDRTVKATIYAAADVQDYWIVNLDDEVVEIYRKPSSSSGYTQKNVVGRREKVTPFGAPSAVIEVDRLLPKRK
jgi:Uma2 family endonuclease